jgi:ABC-2 family transporter protein
MSAPARIARLAGLETWKTFRGSILRFGIASVAAIGTWRAVTHEPVPRETGWSVASLALETGVLVAQVFLVVLGTTAIAGETTQGTLKMVLPHAYRRSDWVGGKALALVVAAVALLAVATAVALVAGANGRGLGDVLHEIPPEFGSTEAATYRVQQPASEMASHFAGAVAASFASLVTTGVVCLFLSSVLDSVVFALSAGFLLFLGLQAGKLLGASREVLSNLYSWYPGEMTTLTEKIGRGFSEGWNPALLPSALRLSAATAGVALLLSLLTFSRRDLRS